MSRRTTSKHNGPSQRQLRVGEEVRHVLSSIIMRNDWPVGELVTPVTVSRVDVSPDLQNALVYVMPLGGQDQDQTLVFLKDMAPYMRKMLASSITLRRVPNLKFVLDDTFEKAERMERLFLSLPEASDDIQ